MQIEFIAGPSAPASTAVARIVNQDALPADLDAVLLEGAKASRFTGKAGQLHEGFVNAGGAVTRVALVGAGEAKSRDRASALERAGAALSAKYLAAGLPVMALDLSGAGLSAADAVAVLLGARLRGWRLDTYRTRLPDDQKPSLKTLQVIGAPEGAEAAWAVEAALADGVEFARELVTEPANVIYPESFVARAQERLAGTGIGIRVLDEAEMTALGMGSLLGVAQGSIRKPRILAMVWNGGAADDKPVAFVGKGVTFDTGGISLKPAAGMEDMKWDMGGAAAVAGTMLALAKRKAKANVVGVCGLVENMPDGGAQRPGDVVTSMSGQTIEVINTDAEGRLVLCDAITWTQKTYAPSAVIDLATLTGAMIISLGHEHAGIFANDDGLAEKLIGAGNASGDKLWRFPLGPAYDKLIDSPIADMKNVGPREGGSITAAQFIQRFVDKGTPWAHLDIAGMVWAGKPGQTWDKGATGYGVRLLDRFVRDHLEG
ncbi:leucyl aminopeptidase [Novosphingobium sp.]|uniref:leucyl aminopeptidase n=1 Tax=Novosphingobium sp. TaxID=1874826 RepID=UPI0035B2C015